jgi:sterol desaturase/sphingolipid hydroxylase (fatty acid hydroxylase superfamily)
MWVFRGVEVAVFAWISIRTPIGFAADWPTWLSWSVAFVAWDFSFYWLHRLHHAVPLLWKVHAVHHQGETYGLSLGIRNAWLSSLTSLPFFVPMALLGFPTAAFVGVGSIHYFVQFWNHSALAGSMGPLEMVMVTPTHHRVHHGKDVPYLDCNFGGTIVLWDKWLGTFRRTLPETPLRFGLEGNVLRADPLAANLAPFRGGHAAGGVRSGKGGDRFAVGISGLLLFTLLLHYVRESHLWTVPFRALWVAEVTASTWALGRWSEGRTGARRLWLALGPVLLAGLAVLLRSPWIGGVVAALVFLFAWDRSGKENSP